MGDWFNLGYRAHARGFEGAAADLARLLGRAAKLHDCRRVLDAGFGGGAQLGIWLDEFRVGKVVGVEQGPSPAFASRDERLELSRGDATRPAEVISSPGEFDRVLALDCAYHFDPRDDFLRAAFACLRSGGRLALTDIVPRNPKHSLVRRMLFRVLGLPLVNMVSRADYGARLREIGFRNVRIQLLDRAVLGGFERFARSNRLGRGCSLTPAQRIKFFLTGLMLGPINRRRIFHYVLVTADKK